MATSIMSADIQRQIEENFSCGWTPYLIEILLHHYTSAAAFPRSDARAYGPAIDVLQLEGLLDAQKRVTLRGAKFVGALLQIPLPPPEE